MAIVTAPDLSALEALLAKATQPRHDSTAVERVRAEAALIHALPALIARVRELEQWQHDMVEKATAKSLDGYRELAARAKWKEEA